MTWKLEGIRKPTPAERERGAEIVFDWADTSRPRATATVLACVCYEAWEQWGAERDVLCANMPTVERWRAGMFEDFPPPVEEFAS